MALTAQGEILERAKNRLDRLTLYPRPVSTRRVRIIVSPRAFRLPWLSRFDGYAAWGTILLREPPRREHEDLVCHELCHVWQLQHHPLRMPLSYLTKGYTHNPFEAEARKAVEATRQ